MFVIREHKRCIKLVIKHFSKNIFFSLKRLNLLILNWVNFWSFSDFISDIFSELDLYLYKLLWKWVKRRHPRRPKTWIYSKYWKYYMGSWKFFVFDSFLGKFSFLISHSFKKFKFYRLPSSFNPFDKRNSSKLDSLWFKKYIFSMRGLFRFLWKRQFGRCFFCYKLFSIINLEDIKVFSYCYSSGVANLFLVHRFCIFSLFKNLFFLINFMLSPKKTKFRKSHRGKMRGIVWV